MSMKILSVTLLLLSACLFFHSAAGRHAGRKRAQCCTEFSTENVSSEVTGNTYREQHAKKDCVKAIIFTADDKQICADPEAPWVQELIATLTKV